jgi:glucokinase
VFLNSVEGTADYPFIGVIGIPGPVFNNTITIITNLDWPTTNGEQVAKEMNLKSLVFLNDFVVNGYGILSNIKEGIDYEKINNNSVDPRGPIALIGAGTGLGHGYLTKHENGKYYHVFASEGGHQDFAPHSDLAWRYLNYLRGLYKVEHIPVERAVSGTAIPVMLHFFINVEKMKSTVFYTTEEINNANSEDIISYGLKKQCQVCEKVVEFFVELYGSAAGNLSLLLLSTGGIYLLGGLSVALEDYMIKQDVFRVKFLIYF